MRKLTRHKKHLLKLKFDQKAMMQLVVRESF